MIDLLKHKHIVYIAWLGTECLYVGMSSNGLRRPLTNEKLKPYRDKIKLEVRKCKDKKTALALERKLTKTLKPTLVHRGPGRPRKESTKVMFLRMSKECFAALRKEAEDNDRAASTVASIILEIAVGLRKDCSNLSSAFVNRLKTALELPHVPK